MFDADLWQEIIYTIRKNKLRTFLTAFSVAWGIFMLIILLGFGTGFHRGVQWQFRDQATNALYIDAGQTSMPYKGLQPGRAIQFKDSDITMIANEIDRSENITGNFYCWGEFTVRYKNKYSSFTVNGTMPGNRVIENQTPTKGRYINELDLKEKRKVAIIGTKVAESLFGEEDPIGKPIDVRGIIYRVIGVFDDKGGQNDLERIYIPFTTAQLAYNSPNRVHWINYTIGDASAKESEEIVNKTRAAFAEKHKFDPEDSRAIRIWNSVAEFEKFNNLFFWIKTFLFVVGICTIIAGIVGVSNIMLVSVKERTKEIGVRKALGATPRSIVTLFILEGIFITVIAGYLGLLSGVAIMEGINWAMTNFGIQPEFFRNPEVQLWVAVGATILLIIAGVLAGYFPARKAAKVNPIEALRDE